MSKSKARRKKELAEQSSQEEAPVVFNPSTVFAVEPERKSFSELGLEIGRFLKYDTTSRYYVKSMHGVKIARKKISILQEQLDAMSFLQKIWWFGRTLDLFFLISEASRARLIQPFRDNLSSPWGMWKGLSREIQEAKDALNMLSFYGWSAEQIGRFINLADRYLEALITEEEKDEKERLEGNKGIEEEAAKIANQIKLDEVKENWEDRFVNGKGGR